MKMKVLFTQKKEGKLENPEIIGQRIARAYKVKGDKVPPAYPCESETLVLLCFENFGKIDPKLVKFCQDLSTARASNVAMIILSKDGTAGAGELDAIFKKNGVKVAGTCGIAVSKGLFGAKRVTDADGKKAQDFADKMISSLFDASALKSFGTKYLMEKPCGIVFTGHAAFLQAKHKATVCFACFAFCLVAGSRVL